MLTSVTYRIGPWTFVPSAHELCSGEVRVRLEQRASATLSLLCERSGDVVSRDEIIERAWGRRHLSPNSVAVVISDLRRALDVSNGEPGSIETVPKAGYRLIGGAREANPKRRRPTIVLVAIGLLVAAMLAFFVWRSIPQQPEVAVGSIENNMGTARYAALMQACNQTVLVELGRYSRDLRIVEGQPADRPDYLLQQRWVLWSGDPELVLVARDRSGRTVWSGSIYGDQNLFPKKIAEKIREFASLPRNPN